MQFVPYSFVEVVSSPDISLLCRLPPEDRFVLVKAGEAATALLSSKQPSSFTHSSCKRLKSTAVKFAREARGPPHIDEDHRVSCSVC